MKALDTNAVVRFLVKDDVKQSHAVYKLLIDAEKAGNVFFISATVILETIWVLSSVYKYSRSDIKLALENLLVLPVLEIEAHDRIATLCSIADDSEADLADLLIGLTGRNAGCSTTLTFDRRAAKSGLFNLISA